MENPNLQRGLQLFELGRYTDAILYFKEELNINSDNFIAKYYLAQCYYQVDEIDRALEIATILRAEAPNDDSVFFLLSQIYLHKEEVKKAEEHLDQAISLNPDNEDFYGQKAYILLQNKKFEQALQYANEGLRINAKSTFCLNARITALTKLKRKNEALDATENLLNDDPENAYSHANVAWSHLENNKSKEALNHFKEALKLDPNSDYARQGMLTALKSKNKIYSLYLRYAFWINNKSSKYQWGFLIGIYIVYRFSVKALSTSGLTILAIPLIIVYLLFALGSWIMDPLSNMILMFDKYGKYLLDKNDKMSGQLMLGLLLASIVFLISYFIFNDYYFLIISLSFIATILPLTRGALTEKKKLRLTNFLYGGLILSIAIIGPLIGFPIATIGLIIIGLFIAYTWIGSLLL